MAEFDVVRFIMRFEGEATDEAETIEGFSHLVATGVAWTLQGFYGRYAQNLIEAGYITSDGEITDLSRSLYF